MPHISLCAQAEKRFLHCFFDSCFVWVVSVPLAFSLSRFTGVPILPLYTVCQGAEILKCVIGFVMLKRGTWIRNIVVKE